ncbi:MAG: nucleoside deaminase [Trueperaceae bacterium]|nr:nucleoside deaminase [Trueperaceae bacterium]
MNHEPLMRRAIALARQARENGNHPFGALLADHQGKIVLEAENTVITEKDSTGHAETNLMRKASKTFDKTFLSSCTLYTSTEPCIMCSGAIYWTNVKRIVFGLRESELLKITGDNPENPTLSLPSSKVFELGKIAIDVIGPILEEEARAVHEGFWEQFAN